MSETVCLGSISQPGNLRLLMNMANDLLAAALHQEREQIDEKLFCCAIGVRQARVATVVSTTTGRAR
jgi:hypothetical protein